MAWDYRIVEPWQFTNQEEGVRRLCSEGWEPFAVS
jgi:hypothetical protein